MIYKWASQSCADCGHQWESEERSEDLTKLPCIDTTCPKCGQSPSIVLTEISGFSRNDGTDSASEG